MLDLNRTVPFLKNASHNSSRILIDRFDFPTADFLKADEILNKIKNSISISWLGETINADEAITIATEQYLAASEYVYGHPIWADIRTGSQNSIFSYILETRHYLAAASSRMSPGIHGGILLDPLTLLLSKHMLEEYDHAVFFEQALLTLGCAEEMIRTARPLPATLEWIHLTREIGSRSQLSAALCSGFMEFSSREAESVLSWHKMLVSKGLLPSEANDAIFKHVETDLGFGHDKNWELALSAVGTISTKYFTNALNDVASIAEMIYRWLTAVQCGVSSSIVLVMQARHSAKPKRTTQSTDVKTFNGLPVWSSTMLDIINSGNGVEPIAKAALAHAYAFELDGEHDEFSDSIRMIAKKLSSPLIKSNSSKKIYGMVCSWLRAIDGHELWSRMTNDECFSLVQGYVLENYHYLAAATRHVSAAISSCPDSALQLDLIKHLEDELEHCELLRLALEESGEIPDVRLCRPLPTTEAFVGYLRNIGLTDWKGYVITSAFLQASLSECRPEIKHKRFYESVIEKTPAAAFLLAPLQHHDDIDEGLGHDDNAIRRLALLTDNYDITEDCFERASVVPQLAWGFLDGILRHYQHGGGSVRQRIGWNA